MKDLGWLVTSSDSGGGVLSVEAPPGWVVPSARSSIAAAEERGGSSYDVAGEVKPLFGISPAPDELVSAIAFRIREAERRARDVEPG